VFDRHEPARQDLQLLKRAAQRGERLVQLSVAALILCQEAETAARDDQDGRTAKESAQKSAPETTMQAPQSATQRSEKRGASVNG